MQYRPGKIFGRAGLESSVMDRAAVMAPFNYVDGDKVERPKFAFTFGAQGGLPLETHVLPVVDAAGLEQPPRLDDYGFQLVRLDATPTRDLPSDAIEQHWVPAVREKLKQITGADEVIAWGFGMRYSDPSQDPRKNKTIANPSRRVHGDFSPTNFGAEIDHEDVEAEIAAVSGGRKLTRWVGYNAWQAYSEPPYDTPLVFCDKRTVSPEALVIGTGSSKERPDFTMDLPFFVYDPQHRWYYYSAMRPDETVLFIGIEPLGDGRNDFVPHTAIDDPTCPADAPPRCSVEVRAMALYFE